MHSAMLGSAPYRHFVYVSKMDLTDIDKKETISHMERTKLLGGLK